MSNLSLNINNKVVNQFTTFNNAKNPNIKNNPNITFTGNITKLGKKAIAKKDSILTKKIISIKQELLGIIRNKINKAKQIDELPFSQKPLILADNFEDLAELSKGHDALAQTALNTYNVAKKLKAKGYIDSNQDIFTEDGLFKTSGADSVSHKVVADATNYIRTGYDGIMPKDAKSLVSEIKQNMEFRNGNYTSKILGEREKFLDDIQSGKIDKLSVDFNTQPGDRTTIEYQNSKYIENRTIENKSVEKTWNEKRKTKSSKNHHDDFDDNSDSLQHHGATSFQGSERTSMDDFTNGTNLTDLSSSQPDLNGFRTSVFEHSSSALEGVSGVAEKHEAFAGTINGISNLAEHLDNPALASIMSLFPGAKFVQPAIDAANGKFEKAAVGTLTRGTEMSVALSPVGGYYVAIKGGFIAVGGLIGGISRLLGNKGKGTGFGGGANVMLKAWAKGRDAIENKIIGAKNPDPIAIAKKHREAYEQGTRQIVNDIKQQSNENINKIAEAYRPYIDEAQRATNIATQSTQIAAKETVFYKEQSKVVEGQLSIITKAIDVRLQKLQEAQNQMKENHKILINDLSKKLEDAKRQHNTKLQEELNLKLEAMQKAQKTEMDEITKDIKDLMQSSNVFEKIHNIGNLKGFNRIAGYQDQINTLLDHFGMPIALERIGKTADVPGGILFFGPQGNGKTTFAEAFAGQLGCELVKITPVPDAKTNWNNLEKVAKQAQEHFKKDNTRTVILINEFDNFSSNDTKYGIKKVFDALSPVGGSDINVKLKKFIEECSKKYNCTVFATTNFPERISSELLSSSEFYKAGLPPANKANASAVLKHYAADFAEKDINYDDLAEQIVKNQPNEAFSNSKIKSVVMDLAKADKNKTRKITQEDLRKSIENKGADISKQDLELFNKQLEHVEKLSKQKSI